MKTILKSTLVLVIITLVAGLALAAVYEVTKDPIAKAEQTAKENAYRLVMPEAAGFIDMANMEDIQFPINAENGVKINEVLIATRELNDAPDSNTADTASSESEGLTGYTSDELAPITVGYVLNVTTPNGYGGNITVAVGILTDGSIRGVSVIAQSETAGLGAVCAEDKFTSQFVGIQGLVEYVKTGKTEPHQIDAISGATITTKAVTEAVNTATNYVRENLLKGGND